MKRVSVYPASIPRAVDLLNTNRNTMVALAAIAEDIFGDDTIVTGLDCTATAPASLAVLIAPGRIYSLANIDSTAYSSLTADTAHQVVKQGISLDAVTLACAAPVTAGQSINYLVQATFQEVDTDALVLPYYNSSNSTQPFSGPNNDGSANNTAREGRVVLGVKAGASSATGTQTTPAPDSGYVGLWEVAVDYGQTTINADHIAAYSASPRLAESILAMIHGLLNPDQLLSASGYFKLPGGLIYQWGAATSDSTGKATVVFPTAFPNAVFRAVASNNASGTAPTAWAGTGGLTLGGMTIFNATASATAAGSGVSSSYVAIGY